MSSSTGAGKAPKRALPSWMSARADRDENKPAEDTPQDVDEGDVSQKNVRGRRETMKNNEQGSGSRAKSGSASGFKKLLDGVVFALSGFVNPERGTLRSQALEMGAEYQPDWSSNCTLLVCAFTNTPKFRQVEAEGGTIVSKDWITECYTQKKLVDIEPHLMNLGKPWRKSNVTHAVQVKEKSPSGKSQKQDVEQADVERSTPSSLKVLKGKGDSSHDLEEKFSPSKVKKWAIDDFNKTLSWLEDQEEKPEPSEIRSVAAEGIMTCLQDAIDLLDKKQDLQPLIEQWGMVPHVVKELTKIQDSGNSTPICSSEYLQKQALTCKKIYEGELARLSSILNSGEGPESKGRGKGKGKEAMASDVKSNSMDYDSDETVEMTEEDIDLAYNNIASTIPV